MQILKTSVILAVIFAMTGAVLWAAGEAPELQIEVRESSGNVVPSAGRIDMIDARNPDSGIVKSADVDESGHAVFNREDFIGFMSAGMNDEGETSQVAFDGKSAFPESRFRVQLTLNKDGTDQKSYTVYVSADSPGDYIFYAP